MTAQRYNPNNPAVLGTEWFVLQERGYQLGDPVSAIAVDVVSDRVDYIDTMYVFFSSLTPAGQGIWQIINYETLLGAVRAPAFTAFGNGNLYTPILQGIPTSYAGEASTTGDGCLQFEPELDGAYSAVTGVPNNTNLYLNVDGYIGNTFTFGYIQFNGNNSYYGFTTDNTALRVMPGRQVNEVLVGVYAITGAASTSLTPSLIIDGVEFKGAPWQGSANPAFQYFFFSWPVNPSTGQPWTGQDIDKFADGTISVRLRQTGAGSPNWRVYKTSAFVNFMQDYRRSMGTITLPVLDTYTRFIGVPSPDYYNMLGADESDFETSTADWVAGSNTAIARSNTQAFHGTWSLRLTASSLPLSGGDISAHSTLGTGGSKWPIPVVALWTYNVKAAVRASTTGRNATLSITWLSKTLTTLGTTTGGAVADVNSDWTQIVCEDAVAPAGAAFCYVSVTFTGAVTAEIHYVDAIEMIYTHRPDDLSPPNDPWPDDPFVVGSSVGTHVTYPGQEIFTVLYKLPGGQGGPSILLLDSGEPVPMPPGEAITTYFPTLASSAGWCTDAGEASTVGWGILWCDLTEGGDDIGFGQVFPYITSQYVQNGNPKQQLITVPVAQDYGFVKFVASVVDETTTEPLTVKVWDEITDTQIGSDFTVTIDDLVTPREFPQVVKLPSIPMSVVNTGAGALSIRFSTTDVTGWIIYALHDTNSPNQEDSPFDVLEVTIATLPDAPDCFTVVTV
jgi:hypothetical protein